MSVDWDPLVAELARWEEAQRVADFWLRDDDAVEPTAALDRLLDLTGRFAVPVCLAVIPQPTGPALAERLRHAHGASVAVHGWSHHNHASPTEKKQELGPQRPASIVLGELRDGLARLHTLHGEKLDPLLVPPWNRIDTAVLDGLADGGFEAISVFGPERPGPLPTINTHVDIMDWHGTRGCRDHAVLAAEFSRQMQRAFDGRAATTGILTHHLVHDESAWAFLEKLFSITAAHPACVWRHARELIPGTPPTA
jgi:peptidoglycan/xylan/chitin deacetylase (PgdA/CDA1 family)